MRTGFVFGFGIAAAAFLSTAASAQSTLYDDFSAKLINPGRWYGDGGGNPFILETQREIATVPGQGTRALHLLTREYAQTNSDNGGQGGLFGLSFPKPSAVTAILLTVEVAKATALACTDDPNNESVTSAEFRGSFFNVQASPTDETGDVWADVGPQRSSTDSQTGPLSVVGFIYECTDANCTQSVLNYQTLGTVSPGTPNTVGVSWNQSNHDFVFSLNGSQTTESYSVSDTGKPYYAFKGIHTARVVPNCKSKPRPYTEMDAYYSNVYVNP